MAVQIDEPGQNVFPLGPDQPVGTRRRGIRPPAHVFDLIAFDDEDAILDHPVVIHGDERGSLDEQLHRLFPAVRVPQGGGELDVAF